MLPSLLHVKNQTSHIFVGKLLLVMVSSLTAKDDFLLHLHVNTKMIWNIFFVLFKTLFCNRSLLSYNVCHNLSIILNHRRKMWYFHYGIQMLFNGKEFDYVAYSVHVISNCIFNQIKCIPIITDYGIRLEIYTRHSKKYICILVHHWRLLFSIFVVKKQRCVAADKKMAVIQKARDWFYIAC